MAHLAPSLPLRLACSELSSHMQGLFLKAAGRPAPPAVDAEIFGATATRRSNQSLVGIFRNTSVVYNTNHNGLWVTN